MFLGLLLLLRLVVLLLLLLLSLLIPILCGSCFNLGLLDGQASSLSIRYTYPLDKGRQSFTTLHFFLTWFITTLLHRGTRNFLNRECISLTTCLSIRVSNSLCARLSVSLSIRLLTKRLSRRLSNNLFNSLT